MADTVQTKCFVGLLVVISYVWMCVLGDESADDVDETKLSTETPTLDAVQCTGTNCTDPINTAGGTGLLTGYVSEHKDMLMRTFYVLIGLTGVIVLYIAVKMVRTRRRKTRTKRYGLLSTKDDSLEMAPMDIDDDDDDDDMTVFDINNRPK